MNFREFRRETAYADYRLIDGILFVELKSELILDATIVQRIEEKRIQLIEGEAYPTLLHIPNNYLLLDKEAFKLFGGEQGIEGCTAKAIVINGSLRRLILNLRMSFFSTKGPIRIFSKKNEARLWLFSFIKDEVHDF
ncbi:MAG: hypothetical protein P8N19_12355 [Flavobacteriales bacterium]|nr:hypothetical protein [Flavobacteriales bacterium]MDG1766085.1 hypothetical protein [Flavobacteriales bacterium]